MAKVICSAEADNRFPLYGLEWPENFEVTHVDKDEFLNPSDATKALMADADFIFATATDRIPRSFIEACPKLKMIHTNGASFDKVAYNDAAELGVMVCNCRGANSTSVAEHAISLMLAGFKKIPYFDRIIHEEGYVEANAEFVAGKPRSLTEMTIGMVGMGAIGKNVAKRLKAWDANLIYYDPYRPTPEVEKELGITFCELPELFKTADCITIHLPVVPSTIGMVAREQLESMKDSAILVNVSRGEIVVNEDLVWALENDQIGFACLDTIAPEPMPNDHPFKTMSDHAMRKVIFTPHVAGRTFDDFNRMLTISLNSFIAVDKGEMPYSVVNGVKEIKQC